VNASRITLSDAAITDILEQADWYQKKSGRKLATRWEKAVTSTLLRIVASPRSGARCSFSTKELNGVRRLPVAYFAKHLVFYRFQQGALLVLRIVHGARDLESLF
jgi:toxin ParE1/3/4